MPEWTLGQKLVARLPAAQGGAAFRDVTVDSLWAFGPRWHGANALILAPPELAAAATHSLAAQVREKIAPLAFERGWGVGDQIKDASSMIAHPSPDDQTTASKSFVVIF